MAWNAWDDPVAAAGREMRALHRRTPGYYDTGTRASRVSTEVNAAKQICLAVVDSANEHIRTENLPRSLRVEHHQASVVVWSVATLRHGVRVYVPGTWTQSRRSPRQEYIPGVEGEVLWLQEHEGGDAFCKRVKASLAALAPWAAGR